MTTRRWLRPAFIVSTTLATQCFGGAAQAQSVAPNPLPCPATAPTNGGACPRPGLRCGYRPCITVNTQQFTCVASTRRWQLVESSCNPPMPPGPIVTPPVVPQNQPAPPRPVVRATQNPPAPTQNPPALRPPPMVVPEYRHKPSDPA